MSVSPSCHCPAAPGAKCSLSKIECSMRRTAHRRLIASITDAPDDDAEIGHRLALATVLASEAVASLPW